VTAGRSPQALAARGHVIERNTGVIGDRDCKSAAGVGPGAVVLPFIRPGATEIEDNTVPCRTGSAR
jgi:hypothetical protein